ncbi:MAG TPA: hypothetical protein VN915_01475 [Elusimicrobiota bacterium]|nr:hypothetical protein [Elusimicrobiota bacterium]
MNKITLTGLILALAATGAAAQTALQQLGAEAGNDTVALAREFQSVRAMDQAPSIAPVVALPRRGKDVLATCDVLTAKSFMPWNVSQAAIMVQTCLNHAYKADGDYRVTATPARFGSRACPDNTGASCRAIIEVVGIKITVSGQILDGDSVLLDLDASLAQRHNKLMGFETTVENQAAILK